MQLIKWALSPCPWKNPESTSEDIRFTEKDGVLYAITLDWPEEKLAIRTLGSATGMLEGEIASIELLGSPGSLKWEMTEDALLVEMPAEMPCEHAYALKITAR